MANDTILTPGGDHWEPTTELKSTQYLEKDNFLSEYETEGEKAVVRENLDVYAKESVYTRQESDIKLDESIKKAFEKYLNEEDPHGILPEVRQMIEGFVKDDGSIPFTAPLRGVDPVQDFHLATKRFVTKILRDHINDDDPHRIIPQVEDMLEQYVKQADVYFKSQLYTKDEIDKLSGKYIKKDGSTPFTKAQIGADPQIDSHLATKRYVDKVIYNHLIDVDPHGFVALLNKRLALYAKASNVYDKSQTYSRVQIDSIIRGLVNDAAREAIIDHLNEFDPHNILAEVRKEKYVKQDGTTSFKAPQKGVDAVDPLDLVTLHLVEEKITQILLVANKSTWITLGPVEVTVGQVEENTLLPLNMTLLEIMDAIFYGKGIKVTAPELADVGVSVPITVCIQGSLSTISHVELYQNDLYISTLTKNDFEDSGCTTVDSDIINSDTTIVAKIFYTNGSEHSVSTTVKVAFPVFVGIISKHLFGYTLTYQLLQELSKEDSVNNVFYNKDKYMDSLEHSFAFDTDIEQKIIIAMPSEYPDLLEMSNSALAVSKEAFEVIDRIPFLIPNSTLDTIYKIYFYKLGLFSLNTALNFNFK